jgi:hypothetical protein
MKAKARGKVDIHAGPANEVWADFTFATNIGYMRIPIRIGIKREINQYDKEWKASNQSSIPEEYIALAAR